MTSSPPASSAVPVSEWFVRWSPSLGVIAALSLGLSLVAVLFNPAWTDEVFYVEPGASLAFGEGFLSNGISHLGYGATWGLSNPGAPLLLAGWFKLAGFGQFSAHAFFFLVQLVGAILLTRWVRERHPMGRTAAVALVALCMMMHSLAGNAIFHARHDAFALLLFAWFLGGFFPAATNGLSRLLAFSLGPACVFFGLQFCGYFALAAAGIFFWRRTRETFVSGLCLAAGLVTGVLLLRWAYGHIGVWQAFLDNRGENFGRAFHLDKFYVSKDFIVLIPACLGLVLAEGLAGRGWRNEVATAGWFGCGLLLGVPVIIQLIGLWQAPFSWMITVPLLIAILPVCAARTFGRGGWFLGVIALLFLLSCYVRLKELPLAVEQAGSRRQTVVELRRLASPDEVALGSMSLYYELRASGQKSYWPYDRFLPAHPELARKVRWLVLAEVDRPILTEHLGGAWEQVYVSDSAAPRGAQGPYVILRRVPTSR